MAMPSVQGGEAHATMPTLDMYVSSSVMEADAMQVGYISLLVGVDKDALSAVRKLQFDGVPNNENI
jgi:hypothetical protein